MLQISVFQTDPFTSPFDAFPRRGWVGQRTPLSGNAPGLPRLVDSSLDRNSTFFVMTSATHWRTWKQIDEREIDYFFVSAVKIVLERFRVMCPSPDDLASAEVRLKCRVERTDSYSSPRN